jgi:hypothetical protein
MISHETRAGEVEGIRFDLRHKRINPEEWTMDVIGGDYGSDDPPRRRGTSPFIWFPWYGEFDLKRLKADVLKEYEHEKENQKNPPPMPRWAMEVRTDQQWDIYLSEHQKQEKRKLGRSWIKEGLNDRRPDAIVRSGDYISVDRVEMNAVNDDNFAPLHDRVKAFLYIKISNDRGLLKVVDKPIVLYGATKFTYRYGQFMLS